MRAGGQLVEPGHVTEQGDARRVEVDAHEIDAASDDRVECFLELLGIHIVLIKADANILGLNLHQLGERILEPAADRDTAAERGVEVRKLISPNLARRIDAGTGLVDDDVRKLCELGVGRVG